jgi:hypothetical protein
MSPIAYTKDDGALNLYQIEETDKIRDNITKTIGWDTMEKIKAVTIDTLCRDHEDAKCIPHPTGSIEDHSTFVRWEREKMSALSGSTTTGRWRSA